MIITRACNNYGPYQHPEKLIPLMTTNALDDIPLPVYGRGEQVREWLYVEDNCRALEAILQRGTPGDVYNIGTGERKSNLEMVKMILRAVGKPETLMRFVEDRPGHDFRYALNASKARRALQWEPEVTLEKGLEKTVAWYSQNREWIEAIKNRSYKEYYASMYENRSGYATKI